MKQLADIAMESADTARLLLDMEPKVTLLSFSTRGSAQHERVNKVVQARKILEQREVDFDFETTVILSFINFPSSTLTGNFILFCPGSNSSILI